MAVLSLRFHQQTVINNKAMTYKTISLLLIVVSGGVAQSPFLVDESGNFLGYLNQNPYDLYSVSNPDGPYGSEYSLYSINNPDGPNGSEYFPNGVANSTYLKAGPRIFSANRRFLGRLNNNDTDLQSVNNPDGIYGSDTSYYSINNPDGPYGSPFSPRSANYPYGLNKLGQISPTAVTYWTPASKTAAINNMAWETVATTPTRYATLQEQRINENMRSELNQSYNLREKEIHQDKITFDKEFELNEKALRVEHKQTAEEIYKILNDFKVQDEEGRCAVIYWRYTKEIRQIANETCKAIDKLVDNNETQKAHTYQTPHLFFDCFPKEERPVIQKEVKKLVDEYKSLAL